MATQSANELVVWKPPIDLGLQWYYRDLQRRVKAERFKFQKLRQQVLHVSNLYFSEFEELRNTVKRLRQEIRLVTRGTPLTVEQSAAQDNAYFSSGTEQLYNTQQMLRKDAVRKLWTLTNPDKYPDRRHLWDAVNVAYDLQDLGYMIELYLILTKEHDPWWRQTEGIAYQLQELERPGVSAKMLRSTPEFEIMRYHVIGKTARSKVIAEARLRDLAITLTNEFRYIINPKEFQDGNDESSRNQDQGEGPGQEHNQDEGTRHGNPGIAQQARSQGRDDEDVAG